MFVALSNAYAVRNEVKTSFLTRIDTIIDSSKAEFGTFCIPSFMGYIIAHIGDYEYTQSVDMIAKKLNVSTTSVDGFVQQLIDNKTGKLFVVSENNSIVLPVGLLKRYKTKPTPKIYEERGVVFSTDFVITRPSVPLHANFMITTMCTTDCLYCYANRNLYPILNTEKIIDVIKELNDQGTVNVSLTGGDIFAFPDWYKILECTKRFGYKPYLSTKTPISENEIKSLIELGYDEIQFSLDSNDIDILRTLINTSKDYINRVKEFLQNCSELNLKVMVRSVLTKINASLSQIESLYCFLSQFSCVKEWVMTPAFFSQYKSSTYKTLEVNNEDLIEIFKFTKRSLSFKVGLNKISEKGYELRKTHSVEEFVCHNQICVANTYGISILANGNCSVCEMLYDSSEYILGNVNESSIKEIWNSNKALGLYKMSKTEFPKDSPCSLCTVFEQCRNNYGKRVCYLDIAKSGKSRFYPDPRCPKAENIEIIL